MAVQQTIDDLRDWLERARSALSLVNAQRDALIVDPSRPWFGLLPNEFEERMRSDREELDAQVSLSAVAQVEARLRHDLLRRVQERFRLPKRDEPINNELKAIVNDVPQRTRLDDIVQAWQTVVNDGCWSNFKTHLKYRHWLAHGRYWTHKSATPDVAEVLAVAEQICHLIDSQ